ncbi:MAG: prepilin-type N-terminal cleavage/methylation domain-containing protein [Acidobacteria bacterium]|nr:prepilin-type N-terminal cleavage/methylation domain-containing protein [Acidobacteriota bacterium]MBI3654970.1 prepilin-type N-terminal cleavage/methylation domain-containing protein [Acidobacteriota bacterium]
MSLRQGTEICNGGLGQRAPGEDGLKMRGSNGFTFIEVMVAQALLTVGLLSIAHLFGLAFLQETVSRGQALAITLAQKKMEMLGAHYAAGGLPADGRDIIYVRQVDETGDEGQVLAGFEIIWTVQVGLRGSRTVQVKLLPKGSRLESVRGVVWNPVLVFRKEFAPLRR